MTGCYYHVKMCSVGYSFHVRNVTRFTGGFLSVTMDIIEEESQILNVNIYDESASSANFKDISKQTRYACV